MQVYFNVKQDLNQFLTELDLRETVVQQRRSKPGYYVYLPDLSKDLIIDALLEVYISSRFQSQLKRIIQERYCYQDTDQIEAIVQWTYWTIQEEHRLPSLASYQIYQKMRKAFAEAVEEAKQERDLHYDSILFTKQSLFNDLVVHLVGYAIDEMRREEAYQQYIDKIRKYIDYRKPKCAILHILQGQSFKFYDQEGRYLSEAYLRKKIDREPLYMFGLYQDDLYVSPVLCLLPEKIVIYGENEEETYTRVLVTIFQERASFREKEAFPFFTSI